MDEKFTDQPITGVWEVTMGCNMRCKHCGSSCTKALPGELSTAEALALCDDIADLGMQWITLSGGEPLTRKDWPLLVRRLRDRGVIPNMITNGWMCTEDVVETAKQAGIGTFAISLDGPPDVHDFIRKEGSFARSIKALAIMEEKGVSAGVITTVQRRNIDRLGELHELLLGVGVTNWQMQIGLPMGNFNDPHNREMVMEPGAVDRVIDFIHERSLDPRMSIYPADCLGYYSRKEIEARSRAYRSDHAITWQGCNAGKRSLGILHNGDVLGCTSIRDRQFIEGNIRERPLGEIWADPKRFTWNRGLTKRDLGGHCKSCGFGDACLGGCPNTRLTMNGTIHSENAYCSYNVGLTKAEAELDGVADVEELRTMSRRFVASGEYQLAGLVLERLLAERPDDVDALSSYGFVSYALRNFEQARAANERVLGLEPENVYATKGLGVVLSAMGEVDAGIARLRRAVELTDHTDMDSYHDLAAVYLHHGRKDEARDVLEQARALSPAFAEANAGLYAAVQ